MFSSIPTTSTPTPTSTITTTPTHTLTLTIIIFTAIIITFAYTSSKTFLWTKQTTGVQRAQRNTTPHTTELLPKRHQLVATPPSH
ncbi:unnamed protein product [Rodentolepis nana]|uniref:ORF3 n=1 Tax=Rodentolepis nana TaxID=102285 RepID=A0A0R3TGX8_RODNA|nr:unnamed protein product [Rodentolepis nana]